MFVMFNLSLLLLLLLGRKQSLTDSIQPFPELPSRTYVNVSDVNIGAIFSVTQYSLTHACGVPRIRFPLLQQYVEAVVFAIDEINKNKTFLPNITLGYVILDDCAKQGTALAQVTRFLPRNDDPDHCPGGASCLNTTLSSDDYYDVVGIIGPHRSENAVSVSLLMSGVKIPQISFIATSDELSNKQTHKHFLRTIPPDEYQTQAILSFIVSQGWTYISVVYSTGSYGENAYISIKNLAAKMKFCIATHSKTDIAMSAADYLVIVKELMRFPEARVVITFLGGAEMAGVFVAVSKLNASGKFIWVGSDGWSERLTMLKEEYKEVVYGSFTTLVDAPPVPEFNEYFRKLKPSKTQNPWFREFWERQFNCSFGKNGTCDESKDISDSQGYQTLALISRAIDSVYAFAYALEEFIFKQNKCQEYSVKKVHNCIEKKRAEFFSILKNLTFEGRSGHIQFDKYGNVNGNYVISQVLPGKPFRYNPVRYVDTTNDFNITVLGSISWDFVTPSAPQTSYYGENHEDRSIPLSVCSRHCGVGQYIIPKDSPCCWDCGVCRDNEIVANNRTACEICPLLHWPDRSSNLTTCKAIPPHYPQYTDAVVIFEICTSCAGILAALGVFFAYAYYRDARVIKAASRELSFLQLMAITSGYITMVVYVATPTHGTCATAYWLFCFSFDLLYAPLLVKAIRIYRIFNAAAKGTRGLKLVSPLSQVVISCCIVMGQVLISTLVTGLQRPSVHLWQPVQSEKFVELACDITLSGLASFLTYNLTLVILCTIFAFKTRKLPDNFNESRFMSMCVTTTLVIWLAFIPTFITSSRQYLKTLLLTLALLLNHSVALIFLFITKLYAVICLKEETAERTAARRSFESYHFPSLTIGDSAIYSNTQQVSSQIQT